MPRAARPKLADQDAKDAKGQKSHNSQGVPTGGMLCCVFKTILFVKQSGQGIDMTVGSLKRQEIHCFMTVLRSTRTYLCCEKAKSARTLASWLSRSRRSSTSWWRLGFASYTLNLNLDPEPQSRAMILLYQKMLVSQNRGCLKAVGSIPLRLPAACQSVEVILAHSLPTAPV